MHCKRRLQILDLHSVLTACTRRAHNAATVFTHDHSRRWHSAHTALLATAQRTSRQSAIVLNVMETLGGRHSAVTGVLPNPVIYRC